MKRMMTFGAVAVLGGAFLVGCASAPEFENEAQQAEFDTWNEATEILIDAQDPELRKMARSGIPAIDVAADSITLMSQLTSESVMAYMYEQDANSVWASYSRWAQDAEAGKFWSEINTLEKNTPNRKAKIAEYLEIAQLESRYRSLPTVLKRTATQDTFEAKQEAEIAYIVAKSPEGKDVGTSGERDWTKDIVNANYAPIVVMETKKVTVEIPEGDTIAKEERAVRKTSLGSEVYLDNEESLATSFLKSAVNSALTRTNRGSLANAVVKETSGVDIAGATEEKPLTFTYLADAKIPTRLPNVPAKIEQLDETGAVVKNEKGEPVMVDNPAYTGLVTLWKGWRDAQVKLETEGKAKFDPTKSIVVFYDKQGKTFFPGTDTALASAVGAYETFVDPTGAFLRSYVSQKGLYDVATKTFKTDKAYTGADGYINGKDALVIDELTMLPAKVKIPVQKDLAKILVAKYEALRPYNTAIQQAKTDEEREAAEKAFEAAAEKAKQSFLDAMAIERIDWQAVLATLSKKIPQATADAARLQEALTSNAKTIAMLSFGKGVVEDISASESKAAVDRLVNQSAVTMRLLPQLVKTLSSQLTDDE